ncbi:hypothetical protein ABS71_20135 [bacterium SCN 62-11]|nr:hypothetical protein [Candidatus Eremiobacteraeota bacterium]ODT57319.1 MAG: hypothetical protein ABS71_20135 [bacterium SCN 62-11]
MSSRLRTLGVWLACLGLICGCRSGSSNAPAAEATGSSKRTAEAVGHWAGSDENHWVELTEKGTLAIVNQGEALIGSYTARGAEINPQFVALNSTKRSRSAGLWKLHLEKDALQVTGPDKKVAEYHRTAPEASLQDSRLMGRWEWTRKGTHHVNSFEFTPWGSFVAVRWLHPKKEGKGEPLEEIREAGTFTVEGQTISLTTFRRKKANRKLRFEIAPGIQGDDLRITHTRPDGTTASANYKRAF